MPTNEYASSSFPGAGGPDMDLADELVDARRERRYVAAPSRRIDPFTLADGYAIGADVADRWRADGHRPVGIKIGLTYRPTWDALGISAPVWAPMYADGVTEGNTFSLAALLAPRVETEVVVKLSRDLGAGAEPDDVAEAIAWAALGFEVVDCHYAGWSLTPPDLVADFGAHAGIAIGPRQRLTAEQLIGLADLTASVRVDGGVVAEGSGKKVLGGPVPTIVALLAGPHTPALRAGALVSTGALTGGAHPVAAGQTWQIDPVAGPLSKTTVEWIP